MARKTAGTSDLRRTGLDLVDAIVGDLCSRGLLTISSEAIERLQEQERSLQSYKLPRFSRELAAIRARLGAGLKAGTVTAPLLADRLERLRTATARLRALFDDPFADNQEIEELAGKTWRESDLDQVENCFLAELGWESVRVEEGFRVDTSYLIRSGGEILCERKIVPLGLRAQIDLSPKPQRWRPGIYPLVGIYPGDLPRRVKLLGPPVDGREPEPPADLLVGACESVEALRAAWLARWARPFPPDTLPLLLRAPVFRFIRGYWSIDRGGVMQIAAPPGIDRHPTGEQCVEGFESCVLSTELRAILILVHDTGRELAAGPVGAVTTHGFVRFGLDG
jgi:hypothetical protein